MVTIETTLPARCNEPMDLFDDAACKGMDPELFFPSQGESVAPARAVCEGCPVREACADYARTNNIHHGVWGGLTQQQLQASKKQLANDPARFPRCLHLRQDNTTTQGLCHTCKLQSDRRYKAKKREAS